jgi:DNA-binding MarR family transcriptional regulator
MSYPERVETMSGAEVCGGVDPTADERITLMGLLIEAHARMTRTLSAELEASVGIPLGWYDVLIRLGRAEDGHLTMSQLASEILFTSGGVTRLVDRMAEAGYVERQSCPSDRRSVHVALTPAGRRMLDGATAELIRGVERHLMAPLDESDRTALATALRKLCGGEPVCGSAKAAPAGATAGSAPG